MKQVNTLFTKLLISMLALGFTGCIKDTCDHSYSYKYFIPKYKTTVDVRENIKSNQPQQVTNPGKLFIIGNFIFLNEIDKGIHVIDNGNPSNPLNVAFIDIPGNMDLAVNGNTLYADLYTDLVTIDITNPKDVHVIKVVEGVFPNRSYGFGFVADQNQVIVDWIESDTTLVVNCSGNPSIEFSDRLLFSAQAQNNSAGKALASPAGMGGSMARFALTNQHLYTVTNNGLNVFNVSNAGYPSLQNTVSIADWNVETIFPFKEKLFIGSQSGMFIYSLTDADNPKLDGSFGHVQSCDPVIADDGHAYVTLRSGSTCQGFTNELEVLSLANITNPQLMAKYDMTNPHGLAKDGDLLFICDGADGLKVYDARQPKNIRLLSHVTGIQTFDVIATNKLALLVTNNALLQYDYSDPSSLKILSKVEFKD